MAGRKLSAIKDFVVDQLFIFETQKMIQVRSVKIGILFRATQFMIISYVLIYIMYLQHGYQAEDRAISGVTAKLKGIYYSRPNGVPPQTGDKVWDAADYVVPPQQNSAFFVTTNFIVTPNQTYGKCEESEDVYKIECQSDFDCRAGEVVMLGSGVKTGRCIPCSMIRTKSICEVYAWCPAEQDRNIINSNMDGRQAENFTVLIKNSVEFSRFGVKRRNILPWMTKKYIYSCRFDPYNSVNKYCPIIRLGDILHYSEGNNSDIWDKGGMISIKITWDCNLDYNVKYCVPQYTFRRLDDVKSPVAKGWNFRYSYKYLVGSQLHRTLVKAYGIQFFITVSGTARQFDLHTFSMNLGSSVGLLSLATFLSNNLTLYLLNKWTLYQHATVDLKSRHIETTADWRRRKSAGTIISDTTHNETETEKSKLQDEESKAGGNLNKL